MIKINISLHNGLDNQSDCVLFLGRNWQRVKIISPVYSGVDNVRRPMSAACNSSSASDAWKRLHPILAGDSQHFPPVIALSANDSDWRWNVWRHIFLQSYDTVAWCKILACIRIAAVRSSVTRWARGLDFPAPPHHAAPNRTAPTKLHQIFIRVWQIQKLSILAISSALFTIE